MNQLSFLAPNLSRGHVPRDTIVPAPESPSRRCWSVLSPAAPGAAVLGLWPVSPDCRARVHNTLYAARLPKSRRCECPHGKELREAHRVHDRARRSEQRRMRRAGEEALGIHRRQGYTPKLPDPVVPIPASGPACRTESLGGHLPDHRADDFFDESITIAGFAARARAMALCVVCPIREACLRDALERDERYGIRGGKTPMERMAMIRRGHE